MRVRSRFKEKRLLILGKIMRKMKLNQKALRRTASRMPVDNRIFKPAALARAIAGVFVCGALSGNVVGAPIVVTAQIEIGGVFLGSGCLDFGSGDLRWTGPFAFEGNSSSLPATWSFKTSEAFANLEAGANDIDLTGANWKSLASGGSGSFVNDTDKTVKFVGVKNSSSDYLLKELAADDSTSESGSDGSIVNSGKGVLEFVGDTGYSIYAFSSVNNKNHADFLLISRVVR